MKRIERVIVLTLGVPILLAVSAATAQQAVAHWKFNEGSGNIAHDSSGRNNEGEIVNAKWASGPLPGSAALAFRDYATGNPPSAGPTYVRAKNRDGLSPTKGFDISANVYIDPSFSPQFATVVVEKGEGYGCSYRLLVTSDFKVEAVAGNEHATLLSSARLTLGKWSALRVTYDGRTLRVYIDGREDASVAVQTRNLSSEDDVIIGKRFTGKLADIVIATE